MRSGSKTASRTIKTRIMLVMTGILFFFTLVAGYCLYLVWIATQQKVVAEVPGQESIIVTEKIPGFITSVQQQVTRFISNPDQKSMPKYRAAIEKLNKKLESPALAANPQSAQVAAEIRKITQELDSNCQALVNAWETKGLSEDTGLRKKLHAAVLDLEKALPLSDSQKLRDGIAQVNRAAVKYLGDHRVESLDQLEITANTLEEIINQASVDDPIKKKLQKNIRAYIIALNRYQAVSYSSDDNTLQAAFAAEQKRQRAALQRVAQDLETITSTVSESPLDLKAGLLRQHTKNYLLQGEDRNAILLNKSSEEYRQALNTSTPSPDQKAEVLKALALYKETFSSLAGQNAIIQKATAQIQNGLAQLSSQVQPQGRKPDLAGELVTFISGKDVLPAAGAVLILVLVGLSAAMSVAKSVSTPIVQMSDVARRLLDEEEPDLKFPADRKDELGQLAAALNDLLTRQDESLTETPESITRAEDEEEGDSTQLLSAEHSTLLDKISSAAHQIANLSDMLPQTVEKITAQNRSINDLLEEGLPTIVHASHDAAASPGSNEQLKGIVQAADEMGEEMSVLALNAAIKAARAGTHGKEFAVVAEELDTLAKRSAESAGNFALVVENMTPPSADTAETDNEPSQAFTRITAMNSANSQALDTIAIDTNIIIDQAREIEQLVHELNTLTGQQEATDRTASEGDETVREEYPDGNQDFDTDYDPAKSSERD